MPDTATAKRLTQHLSVGFSDPDVAADMSLTVLSDTPVSLGAAALLRLLGPDTAAGLDLYASLGEVAVVGENVTEAIEDELVFADDTAQSLSRLPVPGTVSWSWIGAAPAANVINDGQVMRLSSAGSGILKVNYTSAYIKLRLSGVNTEPGNVAEGEAFDVLVVAKNEAAAADVRVSYQRSDDDTGGQLRDLDLVVVDYCTGDTVAGATVRAAGQVLTTNAAGACRLKDVVVGADYSLQITHPDYVDSDQDLLSNDTFTVPAP